VQTSVRLTRKSWKWHWARLSNGNSLMAIIAPRNSWAY